VSFKSAATTSLTPLVCDERAIARLLGALLSRGGLSVGEASRRLGVTTNSVRQYLHGRRNKPSLMWFVRFAEICGARVVVEWPRK
jgi:DNA-binding transcriptional regulator YdaS (Cro superfamily)